MREDNYRNSAEDSYSTVKDFITNRRKYYKKYVLGEKVEEEKSDDVALGSLVHALLFEEDKVEDMFEVAINDKPTGQMLSLVETLYEKTLQATGLNGVVTKSLHELIGEAFKEVKYDRDGNEVAFKKKDLAYAIEKFAGTNCEKYYNQLRTSSSKYIINASDITFGNTIVERLKNSPATKDIICVQSGEGVEVYNELPIFFEIEGHPFKSKIDKLIINHNERKASPYDLKVTWNVENDFEATFRKMRYYIQTSAYNLAVKSFMTDKGWGDYDIDYLSFIVTDRINYLRPLIYMTDQNHHEAGLNGYYNIYGKYQTGLLKALNDIEWHRDNGIWDITRENYERGGRVLLNELA